MSKMRKLCPIAVTLIIMLVSTGLVVMAAPAGITDSMVVDLISVLDCPTIGFAVVHRLDNDELLVNIETIAPPEAMAGAVFEFRYGQGEEMVTDRFSVNEHGRGTLNSKISLLSDQHLNIWRLDAPEWALDMFAEHPNLLVEEGHMQALATAEALNFPVARKVTRPYRILPRGSRIVPI